MTAAGTRRPAPPRAVQRRQVLAALATVAVAAPPGAAAAAFPSGPVRLVLPFPPGSVNDTITRLVGERLSERWRQPVTVDNRPGASSMLGTAHVAQAAPDGHTLLVNISLMVQNPALRPKLPYDPASLVPVVQFNRQQLLVFTRSDSGIDSMARLVAQAQGNPGKINFASWGIGSSAHIILAKMQQDKQLAMTHVPYRGGADIIKAMLSGEADVAVADLLGANQHLRSGRLRALAVTGPKRVPHLPAVPTLAEAGITGFEGYSWTGLFAPAATPAAVLRQIADDVAVVQADPALQARLRDELFVEPTSLGPADFGKVYTGDAQAWASVIRATRIVLD